MSDLANVNDTTTSFKFFCIAIVSKDKDTGSDVIRAYPVEKLGYEHNEVDTNKETADVTMMNIDGIPFRGSVDRESIIEATWLPDGADGRMTSPDVVSGETVRIYRFGNMDRYYWTTIYREPALRRTEHVVHAYGNLPSGRTPWGIDSSYGNIWSTKDQHITFYTSQSNGESFKYLFKIDTKNSAITLKDNVGNGLDVDSSNDKVGIQNAQNTRIEVAQENINMSAGGSLGVYTPMAWFEQDVSLHGTLHCSGITIPTSRPSGEFPSFIGTPMAAIASAFMRSVSPDSNSYSGSLKDCPVCGSRPSLGGFLNPDRTMYSCCNYHIHGNVYINQELKVEKKTELLDDLEVQGNTQLRGTLEVDKETKLNDKLTVTKDVKLEADLEVDGSGTFDEVKTKNITVGGKPLNGAMADSVASDPNVQSAIKTLIANDPDIRNIIKSLMGQ